MTKKEMEQKLQEQQEKIDKRKRQIKEQNEAAKENWYKANCKIPKAVKAKIDALGLTVNGAINDALPPFLELVEQLQQEQDEPRTVYNITVMRTDTATTHQNAPERAKTTAVDKIPTSDQKTANQGAGNAENANIGISPHKKTQEEINAELEAIINEKRAKQQEQAEKEVAALKRKQEESEEFKNGIRKRRAAAKAAEAGEPAQEEPEKEYKPPVYYDQFGNVIKNPMQTATEKAKREQEEHERVVAANRETERRNYGVWYRGHEPEPAEQDFEPIDADKIKAMLQNPEFRQVVENPIYKDDFINNYGVENYERAQEQLKEYYKEQKELKRAESLAEARAEDNAE